MNKMLKRLVFGGAGAGNMVGEAGLLVLRLFAGSAVAIGHGWGKITDPSGFISVVEQMGFPAPTFSGWFAILGEFFGGILLLLGLATRLAGAWLVLVYLGAALVAHGNSFGSLEDFFVPQGSGQEAPAEPAVLYLLIGLLFMLTGSGRTGADRMIRK